MVNDPSSVILKLRPILIWPNSSCDAFVFLCSDILTERFISDSPVMICEFPFASPLKLILNPGLNFLAESITIKFGFSGFVIWSKKLFNLSVNFSSYNNLLIGIIWIDPSYKVPKFISFL